MHYNHGMENEEKHPVSFRLTADARRLLRLLAVRFGVGRTAIIELAIREKAMREGLPDKEDEYHAPGNHETQNP
jgi:hypothetical protein